MATHHLNRVNWEKSLSLDRQDLLPLIQQQQPPSPLITTTITTTRKNPSFLHSQKLKQEIVESRKAFLNLTCNNEDEPETQEEKTVSETMQKDVIRKTTTTTTTTPTTKKISFKIKKNSSIYRRNNNNNNSNNSDNNNNAKMTTISGNKVAELTMKFNNIIDSNLTTTTTRKSNSKHHHHHVQRKPSVKTKPNFNLDEKRIIIIKRKPVIVRKVSSLKRPKSLPLPPPKPKSPPPGGGGGGGGSTVRETIAIFEQTKFNLSEIVPKSKVPESKQTINNNNSEEKTDFDEVQIVNIPPILPQRRCDSMYETSNLKRIQPILATKSKSEETITNNNDNNNDKTIIKPNTSFLWSLNQDKSPQNQPDTDWKDLYDFVDPNKPLLPPKPTNLQNYQNKKLNKPKMPLPIEKIYEELNNKDDDDDDVSHNYEYCENVVDDDGKYEIVGNNCSKIDDGYEYCKSPDKENIYETLPPAPPPLLPKRQQQEPLPPRPPSRNSYCTIQNNEEIASNCYESIYNPESNSNSNNNSDNSNKQNKSGDIDSNYESIYGCQLRNISSNRDSLISSDQQSNSLYGRTSFVGCWADDDDNNDNNTNTYNGKATSDLSASDKSDEWIDMTDNEDDNSTGFIIIRERHKSKKTPGWSQKYREQWLKSTQNIPKDLGADSDTDHHYETLGNNNTKEEYNDDDYDSFDSDTESETYLQKQHYLNDSGVDIGNHQLPDPPNNNNNQTYVLTRLAATAGKHMRKLRRNWSLTKNDISKSLSRMRKRKSRTDLEVVGTTTTTTKVDDPDQPKSYQNIEFTTQTEQQIDDKTKSLPRKGFLNKFRRSMSLSAESANELTTNLDNNKPKSTFYLTEDIDIDNNNDESETSRDSGASLSPIPRNNNKIIPIIRPQSPPPPIPPNHNNKKRSTSWYAEVGLFKNTTNDNLQQKQRPNTCWYAEVGLYQTTRSTPSTSSAENSGTNTSLPIKNDFIINNNDNSDEYYNVENGGNYTTNSLSSTDTKKDQSLNSLTPDIQLRLQDEPLYQFYDAAVLESVCQDGTISDFDSDGYEEIVNRNIESRLSLRPSAMELVSPRNSLAFTRTLWCEIPEVIQSSVLSTLNLHQKKLQEAKFEIITSEASYLNSLQVLTNHFVQNLENSNILNVDELEILFGKVEGVKNCSEKLLLDLEKCWQDNILLYGVIDIVQKHAEENFNIYVAYCENQILIDDTLKRIKEKPGFSDFLRHLETSSACQSLTLYSFLMLPMQRITRWPLLVDAVLKRLSPQDNEYLTCQYALATLNKIVNQCNEAAKRKERELEMKKIVNQLEFAKNVRPIEILIDGRFLIRSGSVIHMQQRNDEIKLTFGRRFIKITLHIFLFNDLILITKPKNGSDNNLYTIIHYCPRNLVELNSQDMLNSLPVKDAQVRHLMFLTLLENQNEKTVEFLLSCGSETDKERWIEALTPPKSDNPDETLYECWDCPQVTVVHNYTANQPDELQLSRGDIINVLRKMVDGWYHGERIRDGQTGWFPANYTTEIANPHVRSRNLKQRYRLLAFSENYLKTK